MAAVAKILTSKSKMTPYVGPPVIITQELLDKSVLKYSSMYLKTPSIMKAENGNDAPIAAISKWYNEQQTVGNTVALVTTATASGKTAYVPTMLLYSKVSKAKEDHSTLAGLKRTGDRWERHFQGLVQQKRGLVAATTADVTELVQRHTFLAQQIATVNAGLPPRSALPFGAGNIAVTQVQVDVESQRADGHATAFDRQLAALRAATDVRTAQTAELNMTRSIAEYNTSVGRINDYYQRSLQDHNVTIGKLISILAYASSVVNSAHRTAILYLCDGTAWLTGVLLVQRANRPLPAPLQAESQQRSEIRRMFNDTIIALNGFAANGHARYAAINAEVTGRPKVKRWLLALRAQAQQAPPAAPRAAIQAPPAAPRAAIQAPPAAPQQPRRPGGAMPPLVTDTEVAFSRTPQIVCTQPKRPTIDSAYRVALALNMNPHIKTGYTTMFMTDDNKQYDIRGVVGMQRGTRIGAVGDVENKDAPLVYVIDEILALSLEGIAKEPAARKFTSLRQQYDTIILDEVHVMNRSLRKALDLLSVLFREWAAQPAGARGSFPRIIMMSATLSDDQTAAFFGDFYDNWQAGGQNGRKFDSTTVETTNYGTVTVHIDDVDSIPHAVLKVVDSCITKDNAVKPPAVSHLVPVAHNLPLVTIDGEVYIAPDAITDDLYRKVTPVILKDFFVFVASRADLNMVKKAVEAYAMQSKKKIAVLTWYRGVDAKEIEKITSKSAADLGAEYRVTIGTNVAETGVTMNIGRVLDTGLMREVIFDPRVGVTASAKVIIGGDGVKQRRGRVGRIGPGEHFLLFSQATLNAMNAKVAINDAEKSNPCGEILDAYSIFAASPAGLSRFLGRYSAETLIYCHRLLFMHGLLRGSFAPTVTPLGRLAALLSKRVEYALLLLHAAARGRAVLHYASILVSFLDRESENTELVTEDNTNLADQAGRRELAAQVRTCLKPRNDFVLLLYTVIFELAKWRELSVESQKKMAELMKQAVKTELIVIAAVEMEPGVDRPNECETLAALHECILAAFAFSRAVRLTNGNYRLTSHTLSQVSLPGTAPAAVVYHGISLDAGGRAVIDYCAETPAL